MNVPLQFLQWFDGCGWQYSLGTLDPNDDSCVPYISKLFGQTFGKILDMMAFLIVPNLILLVIGCRKYWSNDNTKNALLVVSFMLIGVYATSKGRNVAKFIYDFFVR
jgi:hypothetical protein